MGEREIRVDLFAEDSAHESFCRTLIREMAVSLSLPVTIESESTRGGAGKAVQEFSLYQRALKKNLRGPGIPDVLVVVIDSNCIGFQDKKREIEKKVDQRLFPYHVIGCPDPHVEKWLLADQESLKKIFSAGPSIPREKCERGFYKDQLAGYIRERTGKSPDQGGIEYAPEIVQNMDLESGKIKDSSLNDFIENLRAVLNSIKIGDT
jgi:hypothetical protein